MPSKRNPVVYLHDVLTAIDRIREYVGELSYLAYEDMYEKQDAVERRLAILCEAVDRLRKSSVALEADIDWRSIQSFGNLLRHDYDSVTAEIVWNIIQIDLPVLQRVVEKILREQFPDAPLPMISQLQTELWTSWASLLRSYAAAHGLNAKKHAVVEVSTDAIILRVGTRWIHFTHDGVQQSASQMLPFKLNEDGTVSVNGATAEEMDMAAERFARELLYPNI